MNNAKAHLDPPAPLATLESSNPARKVFELMKLHQPVEGKTSFCSSVFACFSFSVEDLLEPVARSNPTFLSSHAEKSKKPFCYILCPVLFSFV